MQWLRIFRKTKASEERKLEQRQLDAWADKLITDFDLHRLNEDICLADEPPYYDVCPSVGDGHGHHSPDWPFYAGWEPAFGEEADNAGG